LSLPLLTIASEKGIAISEKAQMLLREKAKKAFGEYDFEKVFWRSIYGVGIYLVAGVSWQMFNAVTGLFAYLNKAVSIAGDPTPISPDITGFNQAVFEIMHEKNIGWMIQLQVGNILTGASSRGDAVKRSTFKGRLELIKELDPEMPGIVELALVKAEITDPSKVTLFKEEHEEAGAHPIPEEVQKVLNTFLIDYRPHVALTLPALFAFLEYKDFKRKKVLIEDL